MTERFANAEAGSSVRGKLNSIDVPLASGAIALNALSFQLPLSGTFSLYRLLIARFQLVDGDSMGFRFSPDAGVTFFNTGGDYEQNGNTYANGQFDYQNGSSFADVGSDSQGWFIDQAHFSIYDGVSGNAQEHRASIFDAVINPGAVGECASVVTESFFGAFNNHRYRSLFESTLTTPGRQNLIEISPFYGDGSRMRGGIYKLWGVVA